MAAARMEEEKKNYKKWQILATVKTSSPTEL